MTFISISLRGHVTAAHPKRCVLMLIKHCSDNAALCVEACAHTHSYTQRHRVHTKKAILETLKSFLGKEKRFVCLVGSFADRSHQNWQADDLHVRGGLM